MSFLAILAIYLVICYGLVAIYVRPMYRYWDLDDTIGAVLVGLIALAAAYATWLYGQAP